MPADVDCHGRGDVFLSKTLSKTQKTIAPAGVGYHARRNLLTIYRTCSLHQNNRASPVRNRTRPPSLFLPANLPAQCRSGRAPSSRGTTPEPPELTGCAGELVAH